MSTTTTTLTTATPSLLVPSPQMTGELRPAEARPDTSAFVGSCLGVDGYAVLLGRSFGAGLGRGTPGATGHRSATGNRSATGIGTSQRHLPLPDGTPVPGTASTRSAP
ncbi:hypothetical protein [Pseudokineococcus sp. 1T1Z-3]|uniref:hypothetical protein n=1 Tax=Pseudokineococcus sp. 1T1Z-3 TaxID=3132745 RepID=UPI0030B595E5